MKVFDNLKKFYSLLTSDRPIPEIMQGMKTDASTTYRYYMRAASDGKQSKPKIWNLVKNLFLVFIKKLTPARRIAYVIALFLFFSGLNDNNPENRNNKAFVGFLLMNILLAAELADKITAKDELEIARQIQIDLLPKAPPDHPDFEFAYQYESANTVSGDFYDFLKSPEDNGFVAMIGDISGKGMEAALHMVQVHTLIHSHPYPANLRSMLNTLNEQLRNTLPSNQFLTAGFLKVNSADEPEFYRAGHLPLYHVNALQGICNPVSPNGLGLAMAAREDFDRTLECKTIRLKPRDVLCFCTDGVVETENPEGEEFGETRLIDILRKSHRLPPDQIMDCILKAVVEFQGKTPRKDDLTLLVIKKK